MTPLEEIRHSASHVLATALLRLYPDAKLDIGPPTDTGFYYDVDLAHKLTLDDLGTPLADVTFCVIDLETTGGSPTECAITEIGAVKLRGGECLGTFQTLVNPGCAIPPEITVLTGITHAMVLPAPRIEQVLPALLELIGPGSVIVGHNVRFDLSFLQAALRERGYARLHHPAVDTHALARLLLAGEVADRTLATLAASLDLEHHPCHRALEDALATVDLLHRLLERALDEGEPSTSERGLFLDRHRRPHVASQYLGVFERVVGLRRARSEQAGQPC